MSAAVCYYEAAVGEAHRKWCIVPRGSSSKASAQIATARAPDRGLTPYRVRSEDRVSSRVSAVRGQPRLRQDPYAGLGRDTSDTPAVRVCQADKR